MSTRPDNLDLYVLAGQSNMEGVGWLGEADFPDESVWCLSMDGKWNVAADPLHRLLESYTPVHLKIRAVQNPDLKTPEGLARAIAQCRASEFGVGPGISFAKAMLEKTGRTVGLIPAAHGGTTLEQWSHKNKETDSLYGAMLDRIRRAVETDRAGKLKGILWYQGESDGRDIHCAQTYKQRFNEWVDEVRKDTGIAELPVVAVQLGSCFNVPVSDDVSRGWNMVRSAQAALPQSRSHTAVTGAIDLPLDDSIHISADGQKRLGRRLARRMLALQTGDGSLTGPRFQRLERRPPRQNGIGEVHLHLQDVQGALRPAVHLSGFEVREVDDSKEPYELKLVAVNLMPGSNVIRLLLNRDPNGTALFSYGAGMSPHCDLVDVNDDPLLAFVDASFS